MMNNFTQNITQIKALDYYTKEIFLMSSKIIFLFCYQRIT